MIPEEQRRFVDELLARYDVPPLPEGVRPYEDLLVVGAPADARAGRRGAARTRSSCSPTRSDRRRPT